MFVGQNLLFHVGAILTVLHHSRNWPPCKRRKRILSVCVYTRPGLYWWQQRYRRRRRRRFCRCVYACPKNELGWSSLTFCAWEIIQPFSAAFCVDRTVHNFDFSILIKETINKWRPVERRSYSDTDSCLLHHLQVHPLPDWCQWCYGTLSTVQCRSSQFSWVTDILMPLYASCTNNSHVIMVQKQTL